MKFTKEQAVEKLNQALTNGGKKTLRLSTRTLSEQTESLMTLMVTDETELDDFVNKVKPLLETANSNMEHDYSEFVKDYKEKNPIQQKPEPDTKPDPNPEIAALKQRLEAMEKKENERTAAAKIEEIRSGIRSFLATNNVKDKKWIDNALNLTAITAEDNADDKGKTLLEFYNLSHSKHDIKSPGKAGGGDQGAADFKSLKELMVQRHKSELENK